MDAGRLDKRIDFYTKGDTLSALGEHNETELTLFARVWAQEVQINPQEKFAGGIDAPLNRTRWKIRYRKDLTEDMVIQADGYQYDVEGIAPSGYRSRTWLIITATRNRKLAA